MKIERGGGDMGRFVVLITICSMLLTGCSNTRIDPDDFAVQNEIPSNNDLQEEISFENFVVTELKKQNYYVKWNMHGYDVSMQDVHAIYAFNLSFFGVGSVTNNIEGVSLSGNLDCFSKDNEYIDCCDTLLNLLNIDCSMNDVLETFSEETKKSKIFSDDSFVWYLRYHESLDNFDFCIFDLKSIPECIQAYDLTQWKNFDIKMFEQPTIYSGRKVCFSGELISISDVSDKDYFLKKELVFKLDGEEKVKVVYDFGYFPYTFTVNSKYTIYGTFSQDKILFNFFDMGD